MIDVIGATRNERVRLALKRCNGGWGGRKAWKLIGLWGTKEKGIPG